MGGISIWQLVIIAVIVVLLFGTKKLGSIGSDLGASIKGFKKAMSDGDKNKEEEQAKLSAESQKIIEGSVEKSAAEKEKVSVDKDASK